jgi:hypothetical protein
MVHLYINQTAMGREIERYSIAVVENVARIGLRLSAELGEESRNFDVMPRETGAIAASAVARISCSFYVSRVAVFQNLKSRYSGFVRRPYPAKSSFLAHLRVAEAPEIKAFMPHRCWGYGRCWGQLCGY